MNVEIESTTSMWTGIRIEDAFGKVLFDRYLQRQPDQWALYSTQAYAGGDRVKTWARRREYLSALAAAIQEIAKRMEQ